MPPVTPKPASPVRTPTPVSAADVPAAPPSDATPDAAGPDAFVKPSLFERARGAVTQYFSDPTNVTTTSLGVVKGGLGGASMLLSGLPVVGSVINAARALVGAAKACVQTEALIAHKGSTDKGTVIAAWAGVATDVAGIFFPPIGMLGGIGTTAYTVYDAVADYNADHQPGVTPDPVHG